MRKLFKLEKLIPSLYRVVNERHLMNSDLEVVTLHDIGYINPIEKKVKYVLTQLVKQNHKLDFIEKNVFRLKICGDGTTLG